ncbi:T9SS type A sorting domain-containing protein [Reichenbachiella agariperforans]|nr:T9SS type A sorting domain-containing protein [Reichenbachiella agariperforans]
MVQSIGYSGGRVEMSFSNLVVLNNPNPTSLVSCFSSSCTFWEGTGDDIVVTWKDPSESVSITVSYYNSLNEYTTKTNTYNPVCSINPEAGSYCGGEQLNINSYGWWDSDNWQISTGGGWHKVIKSGGKDIPNGTLTLTYGETYTTDDGEDIFIDYNKSYRVKKCPEGDCGTEAQNPIQGSYTFYPEPPEIDTVIVSPPTCIDGGDASVKINHLNTVTEYDGVRYYYTLIKAVERTEGGCNADYGVEEEFSDGIIYCTDGAAVYSVVNDKGLDEFDISTKKFANTDGDSVKVNFSKGAYQLKIETQYYSEDENKFVTTCENHEKVFFVEDPTDYTPLTAENIKLTPSPPSCLGKSDGEIKVELIVENVGKGTLQWRKNGGNDSFISSGNLTGYLGGVNYTVEVKDDCDKVYPKIDLPSGTQLSISIDSLIHPDCNDNGAIEVSVTPNNLGSYTFEIDTADGETLENDINATTYTYSALKGGVEYDLVVGSDGCTSSSAISQELDTIPNTNFTVEGQSPECHDGQGSLLITATKGSVNNIPSKIDYTYTIFHDTLESDLSETKSSTFIVPELPSTVNYSVSIDDNCKTTESIFDESEIVPNTTKVAFSTPDIADQEINCYDGTYDSDLSFSVGSGSGDYSFSAVRSYDQDGETVEEDVSDKITATDSSGTISNLPRGSYTLTVTDDSCSFTDTMSFTIGVVNNVSTAITYQPTITDQATESDDYHLKCRDDLTDVSIAISGGNPFSGDYGYHVSLYKLNDAGEDEWINASFGEDKDNSTFERTNESTYVFKDLAVGTYYPQITDNNGCTKPFSGQEEDSTFQITAPAENLTLSSIDLDHFDGTDVKLRNSNFYVKCHDTGFTFKPANPIAQGGVGFYTFKMDGTEFSQTDGYSYTWDSDETQFDQTFTVTDDNGCVRSEGVAVNNPPALGFSTLASSNSYNHGASVECFDDVDEGSITAQGTGGIGQFKYFISDTTHASENKWTERSVQVPFGSLSIEADYGTTYALTVRDGIGCSFDSTISLTLPDTVKLQVTLGTWNGGKNIRCKNETDTVDFSVSGGDNTLEYTVFYKKIESLDTIPLDTKSDTIDVYLTAGNYHAYAQDGYGCASGTKLFGLEEPTDSLLIDESNIVINLPNCISDSIGDNDMGRVDFTVSGGIGPSSTNPYDYYWLDSLGNQLQSVLEDSIGSSYFRDSASYYDTARYILKVEDINGCVDTVPVNIIPDTTRLTINVINSIAPSCYDGTDGSVLFEIENGIADENSNFYYHLIGGNLLDTIPITHEYDTLKLDGLRDTNVHGAYHIYVEDTFGCDIVEENYDTFTLQAPTELILSELANLQPSFGSLADAMFAVKAQGGKGDYWVSNDGENFSLLNRDTVQVYEGVFPQSHTIYLRDDQYIDSQKDVCQTETSIITSQGRTLSLAGSYATDVSCAEDGSVQAIVSVNGMLADESIDLDELTVTWTNMDSQETGEVTIDSDGSGVVENLPADPYQLRASYRFASTFADEDNLPGYSYGQDTTMTLPQNLEIGQPQQLIKTMNAYPALCGEDGSGRLRVQVLQPGSLYKIDDATNWQNTGSSSVFEIAGISTGEHTLYLTKSDGSCETDSTFTIQNEPLQISIGSQINPACHEGSDGEVTINAHFATRSGGFIYHNLTTGENQTHGVFRGLEKGIYQFQVEDEDNAGCLSEIVEVELTEPTILSPSIQLEEVSCDLFGVSSEIGGGTPGYSTVYQTKAGVLVEDSTALVPGDYQLIVTDDADCSFTLDFTVQPSETLALAGNVETTTASCSYPNGTAQFTIQNGIPPYTVGTESFDTGIIELSSLTEGEKTEEVIDSRGCIMVVEFEIDSENTLELPTIHSYPTTCGEHEQNGALAVELPEGAAAPIQIEWIEIQQDTGIDQDSISGLAGGNYTVRVTDRFGCSQELTAMVSNETGIQSADWSISSSPYCGLSNGAINIHSINEGIAPYDVYQIEDENETRLGTINADESLAVSSLAAGNYSFQIRDQNACVLNLFGLSLEEDDSLLPSYSWRMKALSSCGQYNGSLEVVDSLQPGVVEYQWFDDAGENLNISSSVASGIAAGSYSVLATSEDGCEQALSLELNDRAPPVLSLVSRTSSPEGASNGSITVTQTGGAGGPYQYQLGSDPLESEASFDNLAPDTYQITGQDQHGCLSNTIGVAVAATEGLSLRHLSSTAATCTSSSDGQATILASGGIAPHNYYLAGEAVDAEISELPAGSYTATVVDDIGSESTVDFDVPVLATINVVSSTSQVFCTGDCTGSLSLDISGGSGNYEVRWDDGATGQSRQNLCVGTYAYQVVDAADSSCTYSASVAIEEEPELAINLLESSSPTCYQGDNGRLLVGATGGSGSYSYLWSNESTLPFVNAAAGEYTVTVTDSNFGCTATQTYSIEGTEEVVASDISVHAPLCYGTATGTIRLTIDPQASASVQWSDGQVGNIANDLSAGQYQYQITTSRGCISTGEVDVVENPALSATLTKKDNVCYGARQGEIELVVSGGRAPYRISWDHGSRSTHLRGLAAGQYSYTVYDANSCQVTGSVSISQPTQLSIESYEIRDLTCFASNDGSISLNLSGGTGSYDINWSNGEKSTEIQSLSTGTYIVEITDENGCKATGSYDVNQPTPLGILSTTRIHPSCYGYEDGSIEVVPFGGTAPYLTTWSDGTVASTIEGVGADQSYTVTVTDDQGCSLERTLRLSDPPGMQFSNVSYFDPTCYNGEDGSIQFDMVGGTTPYTYQWTQSEGANQLAELQSGTYEVMVLDDQNCEITRSFHLDNPEELFVAGLDDYYILCTGGELLLSTDQIWSNYQWTGPDDFHSVEEQVIVQEEGDYSLLVRDEDNCPAYGETIVEVSENPMDADFIRISEAVTYQPIVFVDLTTPMPDQVRWILPEDESILIEESDEVYLELIFTEPGTFDIGIEVQLSNCVSESYKSILVEAGDESAIEEQARVKPSIDVEMAPNPTQDEIQLILHVPNENKVTLQLMGSDQKLVRSEGLMGKQDYLLKWNLSDVPTGVYFLVYSHEGQVQSKRIVVLQ